MATFDLGTVPSPIAQAARLAQLRELQNPNLALERDIQRAIQLQAAQQQTPQSQLALKIQEAALQKAQNELDPAYQEAQFQKELQKAAALYGMRPQLSLVKDDVTGAVSIVDKRAGTASGVTQVGGAGFSTGVKPAFTDLVDQATGIKNRFKLNADGSPGAFIGVVDLPKGNIVKDEVTGAVSVVNSTLPTGTGPGQASTITTAIPTQTTGVGQPSTGPQPFRVTPKPKDTLPQVKFISDIYDKSPIKTSYFGKGELPGSNELKERLDALLGAVDGDFDKLNPQAKDSFVFAMNNLRDPRSATLLTESKQIAERMGILDRFETYIGSLSSGARVSPQVARDIYEVISQTHASQENRLINDLIERKSELEALGADLSKIGVPKELVAKVNERIALLNSQQSPGGSGVSSPVATPGINSRAANPVKLGNSGTHNGIKFNKVN